MKKLKSVLGVIVLSAITSFSFAQTGDFGDKISDSKEIKASKIDKKLGDQESATMKVEGEIAEVCQMKGCWMTVKTGDNETIRVTFKDYGFFVPKDAAGYKVVFEGEAKKELVDVETLKHYAEDAGKSEAEIAAITEDEMRLTFVASGVRIEEK